MPSTIPVSRWCTTHNVEARLMCIYNGTPNYGCTHPDASSANYGRFKACRIVKTEPWTSDKMTVTVRGGKVTRVEQG